VHALLIIIKAVTVIKNPAGAKKTVPVRPVAKTMETVSVRPVAKTMETVSVRHVAKTKKMVSVRNAPVIINTTTKTTIVPRNAKNARLADNY
jgi:hypothetical protein